MLSGLRMLMEMDIWRYRKDRSPNLHSGEAGIGDLDSKGIPETIEGYQRLNAILAATDKNLTQILFGEAGKTIQVRSPTEAAELLPLYVYDSAQDAMINQETGVVYKNLRGTFTSSSGEALRPGFVASIKFNNFRDFFISPALRGPMVRLVTWNFAFAFFSLLLNFSLGLAIAILFNDPSFPLKKIHPLITDHSLYRASPDHHFDLARHVESRAWCDLTHAGKFDWVVSTMVHRSMVGKNCHPAGQPLAELSLLYADLQRCTSIHSPGYL